MSELLKFMGLLQTVCVYVDAQSADQVKKDKKKEVQLQYCSKSLSQTSTSSLLGGAWAAFHLVFLMFRWTKLRRGSLKMSTAFEPFVDPLTVRTLDSQGSGGPPAQGAELSRYHQCFTAAHD